ncbi:MAG TPA: TolC family protein [Lacunisphaera sp.]
MAVQPVVAAENLPTPVAEDLLPELKGILQQALAQSPQMLLKNIEITQNEANYIMSRAQMLPSVGVGASYSVNGAAVASNTQSTSTASGVYYSGSISQTLFRWGTVKAQVEASKIQVSISQKNYAEAYRLLALSLRSQYLGLIVKKLAVRNARAAYAQAADLLAVQEDNLKNGRIAESQVTNVRLQAEESSLACDRAVEDLAQSKRSFVRMAGLKDLREESIPDEIPAVSFDPAAASTMLRQFLDGGWQNALSVQVNREWVRVSELNYKQAKYRLFPMFSIGASLSQSNSTSASGNVVSQASVLSQYFGASMSWSIFDGLATRGAKISAMANRRYYERLLASGSDQLMEQATAQERQLGFSYRAMNLAKARAEISETAVKTTKEDAQNGLASQAAVEAAINVNYQTQFNVLNQRADFLSRWAEFVSTVGLDPALQNIPASFNVQTR